MDPHEHNMNMDMNMGMSSTANMSMDDDSHDHGHGDVFCQSMDSMPGMTMYMSGFRVSLWTSNRDKPLPCLTILSPYWSLDTRTKFVCAMMAVAMLGMAVECIMVMKVNYLTRVVKVGASGRDGARARNRNRVKFVLTCFHGVQALLGYILMLVVMSYSVELVLSAVMGLSLGYFMSYDRKHSGSGGGIGGGSGGAGVGAGGGEDSENSSSSSHQPSILAAASSSIPCCDFLQDVEQDNHDHNTGGGSYDNFNYSRLSLMENDAATISTNSNVLHQRPVGSRNVTSSNSIDSVSGGPNE